VVDDQWHHLAGVFNASNRVLYVDGVAVATNATAVPIFTNITRFAFGALMRSTPTDAYFGLLDDLGLWKTALSPERVALLHGLGRNAAANLADPSIDAVLSVYTAQTGATTAGTTFWTCAAGLGGTRGRLGTNTAGQAYIVLGPAGQGVMTVTPPLLSIASGGSGLQVSWPTNAGSFNLFSATNLAPPVQWFRVTNALALSNDVWVFPLPRSINSSQFYRLKTP
jgi:hypothetical protein